MADGGWRMQDADGLDSRFSVNRSLSVGRVPEVMSFTACPSNHGRLSCHRRHLVYNPGIRDPSPAALPA
jgi:hypothetical protein